MKPEAPDDTSSGIKQLSTPRKLTIYWRPEVNIANSGAIIVDPVFQIGLGVTSFTISSAERFEHFPWDD